MKTSARAVLASALCAWTLTLGAGCGGSTLQARAPMLIPARVPVRAFPSIWVAGGETPTENYVLDRLAAHLAQDGQREIRRVETHELEPARLAGQIHERTVVVYLKAKSQDKVHQSWENVPVHYCGFYGCATDWQATWVDTLEVTLDAELTVYEGPSARVLQKERFSAQTRGEELGAVHGEAVEQLAAELERSVDVLRVRPNLTLYQVPKNAEVKAALKQIEALDWEAGRVHLEAAAKALGGLKKETQAKILYNLGVARWVAPGPSGLNQQAFEAAQRAFLKAHALHAFPQHEAVLAKLLEARERFQILSEQRKAAAHNFALPKPAPASEVPPATPAEPTEAPPAPETPAPETPASETPASETPASDDSARPAPESAPAPAP